MPTIEDLRGLWSGAVGEGEAQAATLKDDDRDSAVTLSTVSIIAGSAFAAGAIATALFWPKRSKEAAHLVPNVAPGHAGASFVGSL